MDYIYLLPIIIVLAYSLTKKKNNEPPPDISPEQALKTSRIMWAALLMGCVMFTIVVIVLNLMAEKEGAPIEEDNFLFYIALGLQIAFIPVAFITRSQVFKKGWVEDIVKPFAYLKGNIIALALIEGPCILGIVSMFISKKIMPNGIIPAIGLVVFIILFPNGKALQPTDNPYTRKPDFN